MAITETRRVGRPTNREQAEALADYVLANDAWHLLKWTDNVEPLSNPSDNMVDAIGMLVDCSTTPEARWTCAEGGAV